MPQHAFSIANRLLGRICAAAVFAFAALFFAAPTANVNAAEPQPVATVSGILPHKGRAVIRSGLAWLNESAPAFQKLETDFAAELSRRGLEIVPVRPSALEPMPKTPMPTRKPAQPPAQRNAAPAKGASGAEAEEKTAELAKSGKLPKLTLRRYASPENDADLPQSVKAITPPDVTRALFAQSQQRGLPVVTAFSIPGRLPKELAADAENADYAFIIRFASVRVRADNRRPGAFSLPGVMVAAASIRGSAPLGFGSPGAPAASGQNTYGTPGGYVRGYEGAAPNDIWHRDKDFFQRDYMFKHGPQPNYATPPSGLSNSPQSPAASTPFPATAYGAAVTGWHYLIIDAYEIAPLRAGGKPKQVWQAGVRKPETGDTLEKALPAMARVVFSQRASSSSSALPFR